MTARSHLQVHRRKYTKLLQPLNSRGDNNIQLTSLQGKVQLPLVVFRKICNTTGGWRNKESLEQKPSMLGNRVRSTPLCARWPV